MTWWYYLVVAGFGLVFGSFFNVVIFRLPRGESLGERSRCPSCGKMIHWYDNVPVLSFILLRGRCRRCGRSISWQYPLVEVSSALLFVLMYWWSTSIVPGLLDVPGGKAFQPELFIGLVMVSVLIVITGADITHGIIPNKVVLSGVALMLPLVVGLSIYRGEPGRIGISIATAFAGGGFFLLAGFLYGLFFMRGAPEVVEEEEDEDEDEDEDVISTGVGMGDVKLMLFTGLALGYFHWYFLIVHIFLATLIGSLVALPLMVFTGKGRKERIPFGPFLAVGAILTLIWGQAVVDLYLKLLR